MKWDVDRRKLHGTGLRMLPHEGKLSCHYVVCGTLLSQHQQVDNLCTKSLLLLLDVCRSQRAYLKEHNKLSYLTLPISIWEFDNCLVLVLLCKCPVFDFSPSVAFFISSSICLQFSSWARLNILTKLHKVDITAVWFRGKKLVQQWYWKEFKLLLLANAVHRRPVNNPYTCYFTHSEQIPCSKGQRAGSSPK